MKRNFSWILSFVVLFSFIAPSFASASVSDVLSKDASEWLMIEEDENWTTVEDHPEVFESIEEIDWSIVKYEYTEDIDWDSIPIEPSEEISGIQPFFWPLVARLVISGGKYVIKYGSKIFKKAPKSKVTNALANYKTLTYRTGSHTFKLTKTDMKHMLERHHPKYWDGSVKSKQTFYNPDLSVNDVKNIAHTIAKNNKSTLAKKGTNATFQVEGTVNGVKYVMGITKGHIKQLYPK